METLEKPKTVSPDRKKVPATHRVKRWIKRIPFFQEMDYFRRKIYDSSLFDFATRDLAATLELWPPALLLDVTNRCNAKCVWCPNPDLTDLGAMKMDLYKKIIDDYAVRGGVVHFGTFGEPLMDKTIKEKIEYLQQFPTIKRVEVLTNAFFMNEKIIPTLLENSVAVDISLDELDQETFEDVKKMSYDVVRNNIIDLLEANDRSDHPVPVNFRIKTLKTMEETLDHEFFRIIQSHNCTIALTPIDDNIISNWAGRFDKDGFLDSYGIASNAGTRFNHKRFNLTNKAPCTQLWKWMVVYWDGSVVLCCADMFSGTAVGNLREDSIAEVWRGPMLTELRKKMIARERFEIPICQNCDIHLSWQHLKNDYDRSGEPHPGKFL
ncbi:MAG: tungsten cofactor oxidoreductase radical SAM maturase [Nitrospinaceae bacterium]|nr:MAG: tungsten cofactor oxidoreductase radical SAM maturase [Nitrospinaceae bacterium]